jgi:hypothetical protein
MVNNLQCVSGFSARRFLHMVISIAQTRRVSFSAPLRELICYVHFISVHLILICGKYS